MIKNPWHSRPLDVHRWSEHPTAIALSDGLWLEFCEDYANEDRRPGPKPKTSFRNQFRVLVLDLFIAWQEDPELSLGVAMGSNTWDTSSRYNALHLSKKMVPLIKRLHERGLIDLANGSYGGPMSMTNRTTRIRASEELATRFAKADVQPESIVHHPDRETVILKRGDEQTGKDRPIEYEDTEQTTRMRDTLVRYNDLLSRTFIDIPSLNEPYVERPITSGPKEGETDRVSVLPARTFVRRVFSRGSWSMNGRFYGGWWQQVNSATRGQIYINDEATAEIDYRGLHVAILSLEQGIPIVGDPYLLPKGTVHGVPEVLQRNLIKKLVLTAINAGSLKSAYSAFRDGWPTFHFGKEMTNKELEALLAAFVTKHPHLEASLGTDQGIRLMNLDSRMAERMIDGFTKMEVPILCVHDSFVVPRQHARRVSRLMRRVALGVVDWELEVDCDQVDLDHLATMTTLERQAFIDGGTVERASGYVERLATFRGRQVAG